MATIEILQPVQGQAVPAGKPGTVDLVVRPILLENPVTVHVRFTSLEGGGGYAYFRDLIANEASFGIPAWPAQPGSYLMVATCHGPMGFELGFAEQELLVVTSGPSA